MKFCPVCNKTYNDDNLNFCLDDGTTLKEIETDDPPPTIVMDPTRQTNPNYEPQYKDYEKPAFDDYNQPQFGAPNQQIYQQPFAVPQQSRVSGSQDKTLPIISLALGITGVCLFCCYLGVPFGIASVVVGFIGMKRVDADPQTYDGKNLAIAGMVAGGVALLLSVGLFILGAIGNLANL